MTVGELLEKLEGMDEGAEVRLMTQYEWPFQNSVKGVWTAGCVDEDETRARAGVVYVVEGDQLGYGDKCAWEQAS